MAVPEAMQRTDACVAGRVRADVQNIEVGAIPDDPAVAVDEVLLELGHGELRLILQPQGIVHRAVGSRSCAQEPGGGQRHNAHNGAGDDELDQSEALIFSLSHDGCPPHLVTVW